MRSPPAWSLGRPYEPHPGHDGGDLLRRVGDRRDLAPLSGEGVNTYRIFTRTANNFEEFARARKVVKRRKQTLEQARDFCVEANKTLTYQQKRSGFKYEFEREV